MNIPVDFTLTAGVIITVLIAIIGWIRVRWGALSKRGDDQADRLDRQESRIVAIETALRAMPSREDLHRIEISVAAMAGDLKVATALLSGQKDVMQRVEAVVARHEDHLLTTTR